MFACHFRTRKGDLLWLEDNLRERKWISLSLFERKWSSCWSTVWTGWSKHIMTCVVIKKLVAPKEGGGHQVRQCLFPPLVRPLYRPLYVTRRTRDINALVFIRIAVSFIRFSLVSFIWVVLVFVCQCYAWTEYKFTCVYVCARLCVCPSHFLSTRLQVRPLDGFLQLIA